MASILSMLPPHLVWTVTFRYFTHVLNSTVSKTLLVAAPPAWQMRKSEARKL